MTWSIESLSQDEDILRTEIRNQKVNDRQLQLPRVYDFIYGPDGMHVRREIVMSRAEAIYLVLSQSDGPMTPAKIYTALEYRGWLQQGQTIDNIGALLRMDRKGRFARVGGGWIVAGNAHPKH
jgi:hypothetical protein